MNYRITDDQLEKLREKYPNMKFDVLNKICDFCGTYLPATHTSLTCYCGTKFDRCEDCTLTRVQDSLLMCHKDHDDSVEELRKEELDDIFREILEKHGRRLRAYGTGHRFRGKYEGPDDTDNPIVNTLDLTVEDCSIIPEACKIQKLLKDGGKITVSGRLDGSLVLDVTYI